MPLDTVSFQIQRRVFADSPLHCSEITLPVNELVLFCTVITVSSFFMKVVKYIMADNDKRRLITTVK